MNDRGCFPAYRCVRWVRQAHTGQQCRNTNTTVDDSRRARFRGGASSLIQRFTLAVSHLVVLVSLVAITAQAGEASFNEANRLYEQGKHAEAARIYAQVASNTPTAAAWFNLGNAEFKANELGEAIAAWKQAERLAPRDAAIRANLAFARTKVTDTKTRPLLRNALTYFTCNEWTAAAAVVLALAFLMLFVAELRRSTKHPASYSGTVGLFAGGLLLAAIAVVSFFQTYRSTEAVIISREAAARFGPIEDSKIAFQLSEGFEVEVQDHTPGWFQVRDAAGRTGWVKRNDLVTLNHFDSSRP